MAEISEVNEDNTVFASTQKLCLLFGLNLTILEHPGFRVHTMEPKPSPPICITRHS